MYTSLQTSRNNLFANKNGEEINCEKQERINTMKQKSNIYIKKDKFCNCYVKSKYIILSGTTQIGELIYKKRNKTFIIGYLEIYPQYQNNHYGYQIIEYILSHYKINCIIGETLKEATGFWNKCIKRYNGQRKNVTYCDGCTSSFVIPKQKISRLSMHELLEFAYGIN